MIKIELNTIYNEDCMEGMKRIPDGSVDLTVTSPPYDNLRSYNGNNEAWSETVWKAVIKELYRVTKDGGVVVWIVGDATVKGSETGTSFKQALYFKEVGFNIHDTMIWSKWSPFPDRTRYNQSFEYMFVLSKGRPGTINLIKDKLNKRYGDKVNGTSREENGGTLELHGKKKGKTINKYGTRLNIWANSPTMSSKERTGHPAQFPLSLAEDHVISWSNEDNVILDPFMGSGTTAIACLNTNRKFIGFELDKEYYDIASNRIKNHKVADD